MKIKVTDKAENWFKNELGVEPGGYVHFFGKYGGATNVHVGFSTGMRVEEPTDPIATLEQNGITYFADSMDEWFFANYDLAVDFDEQKDEPVYTYTED